MITGKPMRASNPLDKVGFGKMSRTVRREKTRSVTRLAAHLNSSLASAGFKAAVTNGGKR